MNLNNIGMDVLYFPLKFELDLAKRKIYSKIMLPYVMFLIHFACLHLTI